MGVHLERLTRDCRMLFDAELDVEAVRTFVRSASIGGARQILRVTVFAPDLDLGHPEQWVQPCILVTSRPASEAGDRPVPLRLRAVVHRREMPAVKHVGLFGTMWQRRVAQQAGAGDVLFMDEHEEISEGATWNIGCSRARMPASKGRCTREGLAEPVSIMI